jgi:hypothetical protein
MTTVSTRSALLSDSLPNRACTVPRVYHPSHYLLAPLQDTYTIKLLGEILCFPAAFLYAGLMIDATILPGGSRASISTTY